ncbi:hypothetical protein C8R45DRAFT_940113 [Mycena sanguinolenta]|nr:hypothetical protein C8R45DRAFT_940113 [Mycena sanguinolenta]
MQHAEPRRKLPGSAGYVLVLPFIADSRHFRLRSGQREEPGWKGLPGSRRSVLFGADAIESARPPILFGGGGLSSGTPRSRCTGDETGRAGKAAIHRARGTMFGARRLSSDTGAFAQLDVETRRRETGWLVGPDVAQVAIHRARGDSLRARGDGADAIDGPRCRTQFLRNSAISTARRRGIEVVAVEAGLGAQMRVAACLEFCARLRGGTGFIAAGVAGDVVQRGRDARAWTTRRAAGFDSAGLGRRTCRRGGWGELRVVGRWTDRICRTEELRNERRP